MKTSITITKISAALLIAQSKMGNAIKDSTNPFFKSKYADLNSIREACLPILNENKIAVIQPMVNKMGKNFIETILLHESGEFISGITEIIYSKQNDAQAQGSGIAYARRYGLQSIVNVGAEDDDGAKASQNLKEKETQKVEVNKKTAPQPMPNHAKIAINQKQLDRIIERINTQEKGVYESAIKAFSFTDDQRADLEEAQQNQPQPITAK